MISTRVLEMMMNYMFISLVPVGSRYLHCLRKTALHLLIKVGCLFGITVFPIGVTTVSAEPSS